MKYRHQIESMVELITETDGLGAERLREILFDVARDRLELTQLIERRRVTGLCPMGCGDTLYLAAKGVLECTSPICPDPDAATAILLDPETEHLVRLEGDGWSCRHPIRERLANELLSCGVGDAVQIMLRWPGGVRDGTYRVMRSPVGPGGWGWEEI